MLTEVLLLHHNYVTTDVREFHVQTHRETDTDKPYRGADRFSLAFSTQTHHSTDSTQRGLATDCVRTAMYRYIVLE